MTASTLLYLGLLLASGVHSAATSSSSSTIDCEPFSCTVLTALCKSDVCCDTLDVKCGPGSDVPTSTSTTSTTTPDAFQPTPWSPRCSVYSCSLVLSLCDSNHLCCDEASECPNTHVTTSRGRCTAALETNDCDYMRSICLFYHDCCWLTECDMSSITDVSSSPNPSTISSATSEPSYTDPIDPTEPTETTEPGPTPWIPTCLFYGPDVQEHLCHTQGWCCEYVDTTSSSSSGPSTSGGPIVPSSSDQSSVSTAPYVWTTDCEIYPCDSLAYLCHNRFACCDEFNSCATRRLDEASSEPIDCDEMASCVDAVFQCDLQDTCCERVQELCEDKCDVYTSCVDVVFQCNLHDECCDRVEDVCESECDQYTSCAEASYACGVASYCCDRAQELCTESVPSTYTPNACANYDQEEKTYLCILADVCCSSVDSGSVTSLPSTTSFSATCAGYDDAFKGLLCVAAGVCCSSIECDSDALSCDDMITLCQRQGVCCEHSVDCQSSTRFVDRLVVLQSTTLSPSPNSRRREMGRGGAATQRRGLCDYDCDQLETVCSSVHMCCDESAACSESSPSTSSTIDCGSYDTSMKEWVCDNIGYCCDPSTGGTPTSSEIVCSDYSSSVQLWLCDQTGDCCSSPTLEPSTTPPLEPSTTLPFGSVNCQLYETATQEFVCSQIGVCCDSTPEPWSTPTNGGTNTRVNCGDYNTETQQFLCSRLDTCCSATPEPSMTSTVGTGSSVSCGEYGATTRGLLCDQLGYCCETVGTLEPTPTTPTSTQVVVDCNDYEEWVQESLCQTIGKCCDNVPPPTPTNDGIDCGSYSCSVVGTLCDGLSKCCAEYALCTTPDPTPQPTEPISTDVCDYDCDILVVVCNAANECCDEARLCGPASTDEPTIPAETTMCDQDCESLQRLCTQNDDHHCCTQYCDVCAHAGLGIVFDMQCLDCDQLECDLRASSCTGLGRCCEYVDDCTTTTTTPDCRAFSCDHLTALCESQHDCCAEARECSTVPTVPTPTDVVCPSDCGEKFDICSSTNECCDQFCELCGDSGYNDFFCNDCREFSCEDVSNVCDVYGRCCDVAYDCTQFPVPRVTPSNPRTTSTECADSCVDLESTCRLGNECCDRFCRQCFDGDYDDDDDWSKYVCTSCRQLSCDELGVSCSSYDRCCSVLDEDCVGTLPVPHPTTQTISTTKCDGLECASLQSLCDHADICCVEAQECGCPSSLTCDQMRVECDLNYRCCEELAGPRCEATTSTSVRCDEYSCAQMIAICDATSQCCDEADTCTIVDHSCDSDECDELESMCQSDSLCCSEYNRLCVADYDVLEFNAPVSYTLGEEELKIVTADGDEDLRIKLEVNAGEVCVFVRAGKVPSTTDSFLVDSCKNTVAGGFDETIAWQDEFEGSWYIAVLGAGDSSSFSLLRVGHGVPQGWLVAVFGSVAVVVFLAVVLLVVAYKKGILQRAKNDARGRFHRMGGVPEEFSDSGTELEPL